MRNLPSLVLALVLILLPGATVWAQADDAMPGAICGDLSEEDCSLLTESQMAMSALTSGAYASSMDISLSSIPGLPVQAADATLNIQNRFTVSDELLGMQQEMQSMSPEEMAAMMEDEDAASELLMATLAGINTEQQLDLTLSDELASLLSAQMQYPLPNEMSLRYSLVDGLFYVNLDDVAAIVPEAGDLTGWIGFELGPVLQEALASSDPSSAGAGAAGVGALTGVGMAGVEEQVAALAEHFNVERLADESLDGVDTAVFRSTLDLAGLIGSPMVQQLLMEQLEASGGLEGSGMTPQDLEQMLPMVTMMAPMLFAGLNHQSLQYIGLEDGYLHRNQFDFDWQLGPILSMLGMGGGDAQATFNLLTDFSEHDAVDEVAAPADAMIIPAEDIVAAMQQAESQQQ